MTSDIVDGVVSDLRHLAEELHDKVDDHSLRRSSAIMRRLLVEGDLQRAWRTSGRAKQPDIETHELDRVLALVPQSRIVLASVGGATYNGMELASIFEVTGLPPNGALGALTPADLPRRAMPLDSYLAATTMIVGGLSISRRLLIKYVANKLGGVHFDPRRRPDKEQQPFERLDHARDTYLLAGKNAVYFELLSIGQALTGSRAIRDWMQQDSMPATSA